MLGFSGTSFSFDSPWWYCCNWWLFFFALTAELVQSLKSGAEWQSESFKSSLYLGKRYSESSLWRRRRWGGGRPVYEAVNQRCPSQASGVKIVQESGRIIKRATQIVIKSRPRVIIRVWEIESGGEGGVEKRLAGQQDASRTPLRRGSRSLMRTPVSSRWKRWKKSGNRPKETFCCKIRFLPFFASRTQHSGRFWGSLREAKTPQAVVSQ